VSFCSRLISNNAPLCQVLYFRNGFRIDNDKGNFRMVNFLPRISCSRGVMQPKGLIWNASSTRMPPVLMGISIPRSWLDARFCKARGGKKCPLMNR
jgi:hypothetical protein